MKVYQYMFLLCYTISNYSAHIFVREIAFIIATPPSSITDILPPNMAY